jgi:transposase
MKPSAGERRRQGSITKVGNSHVRRLLVEAAWHGRRRPMVGYALARRQRGQQPLVVEPAWRAQQRLHRRWRRMAGRGKPQQKIVVACARELAGFLWAIATDQQNSQGDGAHPQQANSVSTTGCAPPYGEPSTPLFASPLG